MWLICQYDTDQTSNDGEVSETVPCLYGGHWEYVLNITNPSKGEKALTRSEMNPHSERTSRDRLDRRGRAIARHRMLPIALLPGEYAYLHHRSSRVGRLGDDMQPIHTEVRSQLCRDVVQCDRIYLTEIYA